MSDESYEMGESLDMAYEALDEANESLARVLRALSAERERLAVSEWRGARLANAFMLARAYLREANQPTTAYSRAEVNRLLDGYQYQRALDGMEAAGWLRYVRWV